MMEHLATHLSSTVTQCNINPNEWPMLEACLHALKVHISVIYCYSFIVRINQKISSIF